MHDVLISSRAPCAAFVFCGAISPDARNKSMGQRPSLRRAVLSDAAAVRALTRAAYAKWVPLIGREPLPMTAYYERVVVEHIIELWEEDGQLLALIEVVPTSDHLLIENLAVLPDQQGRGLGSELVRHAEEVARDLGLPELRLYTNAAFASNLAFYARRGFEEYRRATVVRGSITVYMRKRTGTSA
jgi:N-acetylglutamate synthase-like GNAT family acetyltransferase